MAALDKAGGHEPEDSGGMKPESEAIRELIDYIQNTENAGAEYIAGECAHVRGCRGAMSVEERASRARNRREISELAPMAPLLGGAIAIPIAILAASEDVFCIISMLLTIIWVRGVYPAIVCAEKGTPASQGTPLVVRVFAIASIWPVVFLVFGFINVLIRGQLFYAIPVSEFVIIAECTWLVHVVLGSLCE